MKGAYREIAADILRKDGFDQAETLIFITESGLTRFAGNTIHQNVFEKNARFSLRIIKDKKIASASANNPDLKTAEELLKNTLEAVSFLPSKEDFVSLPGPEPFKKVSCYDEETASFDHFSRSAVIAGLVERAKKEGFELSGSFQTDNNYFMVANSLGVFAEMEATQAGFTVVASAGGSTAYEAAVSEKVGDIDFEKIASVIFEKAGRGTEATTVETGEYTVILEPEAVATLVDFLSFAGFGALSVQEGRSFLNDYSGKQVASPLINLSDDGLLENTVKMPFDYEGVPKQKVSLIEAGIARGPVFDSYTANRQGVKSTGHSLPQPNGVGPLPLNLIMKPGKTSLEDMISVTEKGIYVSRFFYTNLENPRKTVLTGMTRDGTFLIEKGKLSSPVKNLRFTQNIIEALKNVSAVGDVCELKNPQFGYCFVPPLKVEKFLFTGVSEL